MDRAVIADTIANKAGMSKKVFNANQFTLTTYSKFLHKNAELLIVYIEGDGRSYVRKNRISADPTPVKPLALELAARDPNSSILYIARPCQYLSQQQLKTCNPDYWSTHRYSEEAISAIDSVINQYSVDYKSIGLVGYSGGGSVAALIAARHRNIKWLITIAANLDHETWSQLHQVTPLSGSLNPVDAVSQLENIRQIHFTGGKDKTVPYDVTQAYLNRFKNKTNVEVIVKPDYDHQCCWVEHWPALLCESGDVVSGYCE